MKRKLKNQNLMNNCLNVISFAVLLKNYLIYKERVEDTHSSGRQCTLCRLATLLQLVRSTLTNFFLIGDSLKVC